MRFFQSVWLSADLQRPELNAAVQFPELMENRQTGSCCAGEGFRLQTRSAVPDQLDSNLQSPVIPMPSKTNRYLFYSSRNHFSHNQRAVIGGPESC